MNIESILLNPEPSIMFLGFLVIAIFALLGLALIEVEDEPFIDKDSLKWKDED